MTINWVDAAGEAGEAGNLNDLEARIKAAVGGFSQRTWTQKTSATPLSAANLNAAFADAGPGGYYDVQSYGAVGDGSTDDTAAIQAAITDAQTNNGIVWFPPTSAHYKVTTTLHANRYINGVSGAEHRTFRISGASGGHQFNVHDPEVRWYGADADTIWDFRSAHGFEFDNIRTSYNSATYSGKMVDLSGSLASDTADFWVHGLSFQDNLSSSPGSLSAECNIFLNKTIIGHISDCSFAGSQRAVKTGTSYVVIMDIHNCLFVDSALPHHILIQSTDCEKLSIHHNCFEAGTSTGALAGGDNNNTYGLDFSFNWMGDSSGVEHAWVDGIVAIKDPAVYAFNYFVNPALVTAIKFGDPDGSNAMGKHLVLGNSATVNPAAFAFDTYTPVGIGSVVDIANGFNGGGSTMWKSTPTTNYTVVGPTTSHWGNYFQAPIAFGGANGQRVDDPDLTNQPAVSGLVIGGLSSALQDHFAQLPNATRTAIYAMSRAASGRQIVLQGSSNANGGVVLCAASGGAGTEPTPTFEIRDQKVGFFAKSPVVRPATYTLNSGTKSRNLPSGATTAQVEQCLRQLLADLGDTSGFGLIDDTT